MRYELLSIDAKDLALSSNAQKTESNPKYLIDLNKTPILDKTESRADNALLYQIRKHRKYDDNIADCMKKDLIFIDFSRLFQELEEQDPSDIILTIKNGPTPYETEDHISHLLDPNQGIAIIFKGDKIPIKFVPFDKSANMAKHCRISYINAQIKLAMDKRLNLGIPFNKIKMILSKWYAYRGLYLTTAQRIDQSEDEQFKLTKESVIVIPDKSFFTDDKHLPEGTPKKFPILKNKTSLKNVLAGETHEFELKNEVIEVNAFDGEGIISPRFSDYINKTMGIYMDPASSFQIRMPFCKGVVHETNFHRFIKEDSYIDDPNPKIVDYFGIERELNKVQIILTKSMLKASDWLIQYFTDVLKKEINKENDPMALYFDMFNTYDHALYISGTNLMLNCRGKEFANYQFLDTLKISQDNFIKLIEKHFENGETLIRENFRTRKITPTNSENNTLNKLINAAVANPAFYNEPQLQYYAKKSVRDLGIDCGLGRLLLDGENRYISGDLLYFLLHVAKLTGERSKKTNQNTWTNHNTLNNNFYMPSPNVNLENGKYYSIMRSPHLSRNEEVALKCFIPSQDDLYNKYFSHLKGVLMLPETPPINYQLSGADYDGDLCKLFTEETFVNAVLEGGYQNGNKILPTVMIPSEKGKEQLQSDKEFVNLIINTFSSKTGLISNLAANFADKEYLFNAPDIDPEKSLCAKACAIVGLEIDRAKSGVSCSADISALMKAAVTIPSKRGKTGTQYFIDCKDIFKSLKSTRYKVSYDGGCYSIIRYNKVATPFKVRSPKIGDHNLVLLPYAFAEREMNTSYNSYIFDQDILPIPPREPVYFTFEKNNPNYFNSDLTIEGLDRTISLVRAYKNVFYDIKKYKEHTLSDKKTSSTLYNKLKTNLSIKYDNIDEYVLPLSKVTVSEALDNAINLVMSACDNPQDIRQALERVKQEEWPYTEYKDRKDRLFIILGKKKESFEMQDEELNSAVELICDFSNDGVLILYYLLFMLIKKDSAITSIYDFYDEDHFNRRNDEYGYYKDFLELYIPTDCTIDNDEEDSDDTESAENNISQIIENIKWEKEINEKALDYLYKIAGANESKINNQIQLLALKYAYAVRKEHDHWGTFFWSVLPEKLISSNIYTEGGN